MNLRFLMAGFALASAVQVLAGGAVLSPVADAEVATCGDGVAVFDDRTYQMTSGWRARRFSGGRSTAGSPPRS